MECKGPLNSRLRRRVSRAVNVALEQDSKKWKDGITQLQATGCKEADKARYGPVVLPGVFRDLVSLGVTRLGETVHVMFPKCTINCFPNSLV